MVEGLIAFAITVAIMLVTAGLVWLAVHSFATFITLIGVVVFITIYAGVYITVKEITRG